jgi:hypothetical protein
MIQTTQETDKDDIEQAYLLLLQAKKQMEADEKEIERLRERNMILEQSNQLVLIQFSNDILTLLSGFDYATPEKGYSSPSLVLSDLNNFINLSNAFYYQSHRQHNKRNRHNQHQRRYHQSPTGSAVFSPFGHRNVNSV